MKNTFPRSRSNIPKRSMLVAVIIIIAVISTATIFAQQVNPNLDKSVVKKRPRIALVLSGGGARGFAHIGVIKVLEENHIPVDYITGASMGALVGALYATGRTPDEIEKLVGALNWDDLLRGKPKFDDLNYRRKEDRRNLPAAITLGGKGGKLNLPGSLNPGHQIGLLLDHLMLPYGAETNFDDLPIPFRCVATDLVNADTVVLKNGSLAQALRATMAIPALFAPVELNGKVLADGGILNNIPTDVAKDMGADIILVVNIETQLGDRASLQDLVGILGQTFYVATAENSRRSLRQADLIVAPDLKNYGTFDFKSSKEIIELGYEGAEQKIALLKGLSLDDNNWKQYLDEREKKVRPAIEPVPEFVAIEGTDNRKAIRKIEQKLDDRYENKPLDENTLAKDLTELTGTERFDNLGYGTIKRNGKTGLLVRLYDPKERTNRTTVIEVGADVNNFESDDVNFNARARLTIYDIGGDGNEWRNDFSVGSRTFLASEFYHQFGNTRFFVAPKAFYENRNVSFYSGGNRLAEYSFRTVQAGIDLGLLTGHSSELRLGYAIGNSKAVRRIGDLPLVSDLSGKTSFGSLTWNYDTRDNAQIPTHGVEFRNSLNYYLDAPGASGSFAQARSRINAFHSVNAKTILFGFGGAGTTFGKTAPLFQQFTLGGFFNVGGYGSSEFRSSNYASAGFGALRETFSLPPYIGGKLYFGGWYEAGSAFETFNAAKVLQSVTGGAMLQTTIGPIFIGGSVNERGRSRFYFSLGRFF